MSEEILKVIIPQLIENFSPLAKSRGHQYFKEGKTQNLAINFNRMMLTAEVKDERRPHAVSVHFNMGTESLSVSESCTCPTQSRCKHVYATLLAAHQVLLSSSNISNAPVESPVPAKVALPLPPPPPPPPTNLSPSLSEWVLKVEQQAKGNGNSEVTPPKERKIAWKLVLNEGVKPTLCLSMEVVRLLKSGEYAQFPPQACCIADLLRSYSTTAAVRSIMDTNDWSVITALAHTHCDSLNYSVLTLSRPPSHEFLQQLLSTERCHLGDIHTPALQWGEERPATIVWELSPGSNAQRAVCRSLDTPASFFLGGDYPFYLDPQQLKIGPLSFEAPLSLVKALLAAPAVAHDELAAFQKVLTHRLPMLTAYAPPAIRKRTIAGKPVNCFHLAIKRRGAEQSIIGTLSFEYDTERLPLGALNEEIIYKTTTLVHKANGEILTVERATALERQAVKVLLSELRWEFYITQTHGNYQVVFRPTEKGDFMDTMIAILSTHKKELEKRNWRVTVDDALPFRQVEKGGEWFMESAGGGDWKEQDWFDLQLGTYISGERINLTPALLKMIDQVEKSSGEFLENLEERDPDALMPLATEDRRIVMVSVGRVRAILQTLIAQLQGTGAVSKQGNLRIARWSAGFLAELGRAQDAADVRWVGPDALYNFAEKIQGQQSLAPVEIPLGLHCTLRTYQREGLNWLQFLRSCHMNGILADDMGLGKTVQALAHILVEKESGRMRLPVLVVAPTSLMPNWRSEVERLAPSLRVLVLQGMNRHQYFDKISHHDIILTTYPLLMRDRENLLAYEFHMLILDEAQAIKNSDTQAYQIVQQIKAKHRLCLSGTPMENHLGELWSLFNFLLPGFLGDKKTFHNTYRKPIEKEGDMERRDALVQRTKPFILRRTKQLVATELPAKTEIIQKIELGPQQRDLYEAIRLKAQTELMRQIEEKGLARSQIAVLDALLKLRQVCCDPRLLRAENQLFEAESAKLEFLMEILPQMIEENRKVLIFSQFTSMLALIERELHAREISYTILTGDTVDRSAPVNRFQQGEVPLMLLSLKAGGVGLNLTAADTVILFDPWWNPAVEEQATDRAHRIGQTKAVFVYKLVTSGTVEEKILALQDRKKEMMAALLDAQDGTTVAWTIEDLANILTPLAIA